MSGSDYLTEGLLQVAEWADAYVQNETTIPETSSSDLSDEKKSALLLIELLLKVKAVMA